MVKRANYLILRHEGSYEHVGGELKATEELGQNGLLLRTEVGQDETPLSFQLDRRSESLLRRRDCGEVEVLSTDYIFRRDFKPWRERVWRRLIRAVGFQANGVWNAEPELLTKANYEAIEENLILQLGAIPIDWNETANCARCGEIPAPAWLKDACLQFCQMCHVKSG